MRSFRKAEDQLMKTEATILEITHLSLAVATAAMEEATRQAPAAIVISPQFRVHHT